MIPRFREYSRSDRLVAAQARKQCEPEYKKTPQKQGFQMELDGIEPTRMQGIHRF